MCLLAPATAAAQAATGSSVSGTLALDASSRYLFSGLTFSADPVVHPSVAVSRDGLTVTAYATWYAQTERLDEADVFVEYSRNVAHVSLSGGVSRYHFRYPDGWSGTFEAYVSATWNVTLSPTLTITEDFRLGDGGLVAAGLGHGWAPGGHPVYATLSVVHNRHYYSDLSGVSHVQLAVEADLAFGRVSLVPKLTGVASLRDDVESTVAFGAEVRLGL